MGKFVQFCSFISFVFFIPANFWVFFFLRVKKPAPRTSRSFSKAANLLAFISRFPSALSLISVWQKLSHSPKQIHSHSGVRDDQLLNLLNAFTHQGFSFGGQFRDRCLVVNLARQVDGVISRILTDPSWKPTFWIVATKLEYGLNVSVLLRTKRPEPQPSWFSYDPNRKLMQHWMKCVQDVLKDQSNTGVNASRCILMSFNQFTSIYWC